MFLLLSQNSNVGEFVDDILRYLIVYTTEDLIDSVLDIMEILAYKFRPYLKHELESIVEMWNRLIRSKNTTKETAIKIFKIYRHLKDLMDPYLHVILPFFCDNFLNTPSGILTQEFLHLLVGFARHCSSTVEYTSLLTQHLVRLMEVCNDKDEACKNYVINCFVSFIIIFKDEYVVYLPLIHKAAKNGMEYGFYAKCIRYLQSHSSI